MQQAELPLDDLTVACMEFWKKLVMASGNLAYRLAFNSLLVTYVSDAGIAAADHRERNQSRRGVHGHRQGRRGGDGALAKTVEALMVIGSDAIYAAIDLFQQMQNSEG